MLDVSAWAQVSPYDPLAMKPELQLVSRNIVAGEQGRDFQTWQRVETFQDSAGNPVQTTNLAYMEMQTGMYYLEGKDWKRSSEIIEACPGGALARQGGHKVIFADNLAAEVVVDLEMADGQRLKSRILGLSYLDSATGKTVFIGEVKASTGEIIYPNQVQYADAFAGVKADVRYTYTRAGLEQDVILRERPPTPESFGLDSQTTRFQVVTEFLSPMTPEIQAAKLTDEAGDLEDQMLDFGAMQMGAGTAFVIGLDGSMGEKVPVAKHWVVLDGRTILIEEVAVVNLIRQLEALPAKKRSAFFWHPQPAPQRTAAKLNLPAHKTAVSAPQPMRLAKGTVPARGVVLDYLLLSSQNNYTFKGDTTYYVNGSVNLSGTTTIEGGAVVKYAVNAAIHIIAPGIVKSATAAYRPAMFTAKDDNTVGEIISGSSGNPLPGVYYANPALDLPTAGNPALQYLRFVYAQQAVTLGTAVWDFSHFQFVKCNYGAVAGASQSITLTLKNALFTNVKYPFDLSAMSIGGGASIGAQNVTFDSVTALVNERINTSYGLNFVNCILANVTNTGWNGSPSLHLGGNNNGLYNTPFTFGTGTVPSNFNPPISPFQTVGAGNYYLANGCNFINAGTGAIDPVLLSALSQKTTTAPPNIFENQTIPANTTWSPQVPRDTSCTSPNLGYHYDPLDVCASRATLGGTLTANPGTAVGYFGVYGFRLGTLSIQGTPLNRCKLAHYSAVQEQPLAWGANASACSLLQSGVMPVLKWRFADVSTADGTRFGGGAANNLDVAHCSLYVARMTCDSGSIVTQGFTNNILERCTLGYGQCGGAGYSVRFDNNLFLNSSLSAGYFCYAGFVSSLGVYNNLFAKSSFTYSTSSGMTPQILNNGYYSSTVTSQGTLPKSISTLDFQAGPLGPYYYPTTGGNLSQLVDAGNLTSIAVGLDQFTTRTDQTLDSGTVDIGFHYSTLSRPQANDLTGQVCRNHSVSITLSGSSPNTASCVLFYTVLTQPQHGTLSGTPPNLTYTETDLNFCGNDTFTYKVNDGYLDSLPATVTIAVGDPNPVANCQDVMTGVNTQVTFPLSGSGNTCGETLTFNVVPGSGPGSGVLSALAQNGANQATVTYMPNTGFEGTDGFDFTVSDCGFVSPSAHVTINVASPPILVATCSPNSILLRWTTTPGVSVLATEFLVKRSTTPGGPYTVIHSASATDRSFTDTGISPGITYCYVVTVRHHASLQCGGLFTEVPSNEICLSTCSNPPCGQERISDWVFTDEGFIGLAGNLNGAFRVYTDPSQVTASPWSFQSANMHSLRMSFENDNNCLDSHGPPNNPNTQSGTTEATITVGCLTRMTVTWSGVGEQQASNYEKMSLFVDGGLVGSAHAPGGGLGCATMAPVVSSPAPPQFIDLQIGTHILRIETTTNDSLYHFGAFYQFDLSFAPL